MPTPPQKTSPQKWTDSQRAAINHTAGDLLVSAAAGSGKTAVLAERCAQLVCGEIAASAADPATRTGVENLLVLTFTDAAANEMRTRIAHALQQNLLHHARAKSSPATLHWLRRQAAMVDRAGISTLHAFCSRTLRQHFHEANVDPAFEVIDADEARLLQDEVLDDLLTRWHRLPAESPQAKSFADFFEAYAQGRDTTCKDLILALHRMLASTADPEKYLAAARAMYSTDAAKTLDAYIKVTLAGKLRIAGIAARRSIERIAVYPDATQMLTALQAAAKAIDAACARLTTDGLSAWQAMPEMLAIAWPKQIKTIHDIPDFENLKKRSYAPIKDKVNELTDKFAGDPAQMLADLKSLAPSLETHIALAQDFDDAFTRAKRAQNRLDFADLERLTLNLLRSPTHRAVHELRERYHYLLVDEFQDINPLQAALLDAVRSPARFNGTGPVGERVGGGGADGGGGGGGGGAGNLFLVGDVKQSIYGFRLAEPALFLAREHQARQQQIAAPTQHALITLPHNFRSHPHLIAVMNALFEKILTPEVAGIAYHDGHALEAGIAPAPESAASEGGSPLTGTPVELHLAVLQRESDEDETDESDSDSNSESGADETSIDKLPAENLSAVEQEARIVADRIAALMNENRTLLDRQGRPKNLAYKDIAILLRTMRNKAMIFARALAHRGIPVHADLSTGFFDTPEVRDTLALLHTLDNPQQDIPLATVLLGPYGRFSHDDLAIIRLTFDKKEVPFSTAATRYASIDPSEHSTIDQSKIKNQKAKIETAAPPFSDDLALRLQRFFKKLDAWRELVRSRPLHEGLAQIFAESKILAYVAGLDTGTQRVANLQMLHERALKFASFRKQGLHRFLRFIEGLRESESGGGGGDFGEASVLSEASDVVRIMSVHKSKGLEFPAVFVSGLGAKFNLTGGGRTGSGGAVMVHRDLGVGLHIADIERNVYYPSPATLRIADAEARSQRAEELRLLYVAITRARDALFLTGHIQKQSTLDKHRQAFPPLDNPNNDSPVNDSKIQSPDLSISPPPALPEDLLLKGNTALDWLLPALAAAESCPPNTPGHLSLNWNQPPAVPLTNHQIQIILHPPQTLAPSNAEEDAVENQKTIAALLTAQPLPDTPAASEGAADPRITRLIQRVTGTYAYDAITRQPAVQTVTFLKTLADTFLPPDEFTAAPPPTAALESRAAESATAPRSAAAAEAARLRGIATHRLLELLDFAACDTPAALEQQIQKLLDTHALTREESNFANWQSESSGIPWFLFHSATGQRLRAFAHQRAAATPPHHLHLRREIPFTTLAPCTQNSEPRTQNSDPTTQNSEPRTQNSADAPTLRGIIDVLLVNTQSRTAEILDYKTDSTFLYQTRLPDYQRQMQYYLAAAAEILGFPVQRATLIFLSPQQEIIVTAQ